MQTIELAGTPNAVFNGFLLVVESDNDSEAGVVEEAESISGTFDGNGLMHFNISDLEDHSHTFFLVSTFSGTAGTTDLDTNNDGTPDDISTLGTIYDVLGVPISSDAILYGSVAGGVDLTYTALPSLVFRGRGTNNWFQATNTEVYTASGADASAAFGGADVSTPTLGSANPVDSPADTTPRINEFLQKHDEGQQVVELAGTAGASFQGYFLLIESDMDDESGVVEEVLAVDATFDATGLYVLDVSSISDHWDDHSHTYMLVSRFTGADETDLDMDNDGTPDNTGSLGFVYDSIAIPLAATARLYAGAVGGTDLTFAGTRASLVFRGRGTDAVFQVVGGAALTAGGAAAASAFGGADVSNATFGSANPVDSPADTTPRINEFLQMHDEGQQVVELAGTAGASFQGYFLLIESDRTTSPAWWRRCSPSTRPSTPPACTCST